MKQRELIPLRSATDIPEGLTEAQARDFWDTHEVTDEYLEKAESVPPKLLPPVRARSTHIALRIHEDTLRRIKAVARRRHKGYQTLLKEFVIERLYEEEKREGLLRPASRGSGG